MNKEDFDKLYGNLFQKQKVIMVCSCGRSKKIFKEKAEQNIKAHDGEYICRSCASKQNHVNNPRTEETRQKQREGRLGKTHSEKSKQLMAKIKNEFYQTEQGQKVKKRLAAHTSKQHASKKFDKSKRKILYISAKNNNEIRTCNSSYEYIACEDFFEKDDAISSYECQVPYQVEDRHRSLDFLLTYKDGSKKAIEIKPYKRLGEDYHVLQMYDSHANAKNNGWEFEIWSEHELNINKSKEATARADEYRKVHYLIDYASYRQEKNNIRAKKHYDQKISKDKVVVFCDYCKDYHFPLRLTYDRNIKRNDTYICEKHGGHIAGSKPKKKKENPYAILGQKKCEGKNSCDRLLPLDCFSAGKSVCKECRAKVYAQKYQEKKLKDKSI